MSVFSPVSLGPPALVFTVSRRHSCCPPLRGDAQKQIVAGQGDECCGFGMTSLLFCFCFSFETGSC